MTITILIMSISCVLLFVIESFYILCGNKIKI